MSFPRTTDLQFMHMWGRPEHTLASWYTCFWIGRPSPKLEGCALHWSRERWQYPRIASCLTFPRPQPSAQVCSKNNQTLPWEYCTLSTIVSELLSNSRQIMIIIWRAYDCVPVESSSKAQGPQSTTYYYYLLLVVHFVSVCFSNVPILV